jgi:quinol monooxygenase YgiN
MSKVALIVKLPIKAGQRDEFLAAFSTGIATAETEPGTLMYIAHKDAADENVVWIYELYTDNEALGAHGGSDAFKALSASIGGFIDGKPEMHFLAPHEGKGL